MFSHAKYFYNLAGSKTSLAWNGDPNQDRKTQNIIQLLEIELGVLLNFKRNGVIVHPGNYTDREARLKAISRSISKLDFPENSKLLLENSAVKEHHWQPLYKKYKPLFPELMNRNKNI